MSSTLLLPLDGSEKDQWAVVIAATFAELTRSNVLIVRVIDPAIDDRHRHFVGRCLRKAVDRLANATGLAVSCEVAEGADVANVLLRMADEQDVQLVVMATRAASGLDRAIRGSVADRLVRESRRPIIVAPPGADHLRGSRLRLRRALVPVDGSRASLRVIEHLASWPLANELEIVLLQATEAESTGGYMMPVAVTSSAESTDDVIEWVHVNAERAENELNVLSDDLRATFATVDVRVVERKDAAGAILDATRQELVDFIAMTTRGAGGIKRLVLGSVAEQVVRDSEIPVLLVTPQVR